MVVARREDAQVVGSCDGGSVASLAIAGREAVFRDGGFLYIVATFCADEKAFVTKSQVNVRYGPFEEINKGANVEIGLLVVEVELAAVGALRGHVVGEDLGFEAFRKVVFELELGVETVGGCPRLGQG